MPHNNVMTSIADVRSPDCLLMKLSVALATATGMPEPYYMSLLDSGVPITFAGIEDPCSYVEIKSMGALKLPPMTDLFCKLIK